jgi:hypothetical protein
MGGPLLLGGVHAAGRLEVIPHNLMDPALISAFWDGGSI